MKTLTSIIESLTRPSLYSLISSYISEYSLNDYSFQNSNLSYRKQLENIYKPSEGNCYFSEKLVGDVAKIFAGQYYKNNKRVWLWEDRLKEFEAVYYQLENTGYCMEQLQQLKPIVKSNTYLKKKHPKIVKKICKKIERKSLKTKILKYLAIIFKK